MSSARSLLPALAIAAIAATQVAAPAPRAAQTREFTVVNVEYQGTKLWLPSTLVVRKGDRVRIHLLNNVPSGSGVHGFSIPGYGIEEVVARGKPRTIEFTAEHAGIFPFRCQLHPGHVGGQLLVEE